MEFVLILEEDNGCDYTIGCGIAMLKVSASNIDEAIENAFPTVAHNYGDPGNGFINEDITLITLLAISDSKILDLDQYRSDYKAGLAKETISSIEAQERAELERLKRKYRS